MSKIRKSARGEYCTIRIPNVCSGNPEETVLCHAPYIGRYGSRKDDLWAAYACASCHDYLDGRMGHKTDTAEHWLRGIKQTQDILIDKKLLIVVE